MQSVKFFVDWVSELLGVVNLIFKLVGVLSKLFDSFSVAFYSPIELFFAQYAELAIATPYPTIVWVWCTPVI